MGSYAAAVVPNAISSLEYINMAPGAAYSAIVIDHKLCVIDVIKMSPNKLPIIYINIYILHISI